MASSSSLPHLHVYPHHAPASSTEAAAANAPVAATPAPAAPAAAAAPAAPLSFSFSSTARPQRAAASVTAALSQASRSGAPAAVERQVISGSLSSSSLAASHRRAEEGANGLGAKGLVIPLIKQTNWREGKGAPPSNPSHLPSLASTAGVATLKARDAGASAGIAFESEQDLLDEAYAAKQAARAEAAAAAASSANAAAAVPSSSEDALPALQTVVEAAATPLSLDAQAAAALLADSTLDTRGGGPSLPSAETQDAFARAAPILVANALPGNNRMLTEEQRLALDVELRPEESTLDDYARVPISEFGAGMLRGMGWGGLGDTIGGINKAVVEPVQFAPRGERMGLGATFAKVKDNRGPKRFIKPGETREQGGVIRVAGGAAAAAASSVAGPTAAELKAKSLRALGSRLIQVHSQQLRVGALVEVVDGAHRKSYGKLLRFSDVAAYPHVDDVPITVKLNLTGETVELTRGQVEILDERAMPDDHPAFETADIRAKRLAKEAQQQAERSGAAAMDESKDASSSSSSSKRDRSSRDEGREEESSSSKKHRSSSSSHKRSRSRSKDRHHHHRDHHHHSSSSSSSSSSRHHSSSSAAHSSSSSSSSGPPRWVRSHIRVRIVSSSFASGAYYKVKGVVVDVSSGSHILVRPDGGGKIIEGLAERHLESVIPAAGQSRVIMLRGEHKGAIGKLLQKQTDKARAVVQLDEDLNIITVDFDDIAEYVQ